MFIKLGTCLNDQVLRELVINHVIARDGVNATSVYILADSWRLLKYFQRVVGCDIVCLI